MIALTRNESTKEIIQYFTLPKEAQQTACSHKLSECGRSEGAQFWLAYSKLPWYLRVREWDDPWSLKKEEASYTDSLTDVSIWRATFIFPLSRSSEPWGVNFCSTHPTTIWITILSQNFPTELHTNLANFLLDSYHQNVSQFSPPQPVLDQAYFLVYPTPSWSPSKCPPLPSHVMWSLSTMHSAS